MSALELLAAVAVALVARGHQVVMRAVLPGSCGIYVAEQLAVRTCRETVRVVAAEVFDGFKHVVPDGCDTAVFTLGSRRATAESIVREISSRMEARARSLPLPADPSAIVRDPVGHACSEDKQGLCHTCGDILKPGRAPSRRRPVMLRDLASIATEVGRHLTNIGAPGGFTRTPGPAVDFLTWTGARRHEGEAERALVEALAVDGHDAERLPGFGVRVTRIISVSDHGTAVHNIEPPAEVVTECESDEAFVERWDPSIETAAE